MRSFDDVEMKKFNMPNHYMFGSMKQELVHRAVNALKLTFVGISQSPCFIAFGGDYNPQSIYLVKLRLISQPALLSRPPYTFKLQGMLDELASKRRLQAEQRST